MKITDKHFIDWESDVFGYGYGTGEQYTLSVLKQFFQSLKPTEDGSKPRSYQYETLEKNLTPTVAWLLINTLCNANMIDYGGSPRYGWLSWQGELLRDYLEGKSVGYLYDLVMVDENYIHCYRWQGKECNCDGVKCKNPLFSTELLPPNY